MNVRYERIRWFTVSVIERMKTRKLLLTYNFLACLMIGGVGVWVNAPGEWIIGGISVIQGINIGDIIQAYIESKRQNPPIKYDDEDEPPEKWR